MSSIKDFSDSELQEEILRRMNAKAPSEREIKWCDDCRNFLAWEKDCDPPESYNPCIKAHQMSFKVPEGYQDDFGFYRRVCPDREELEAA